MNSNTRNIITVLLWLGTTSIIYFLCLLVHMPFIITALIVLASLYYSYKYTKNIQTTAPNHIWLYTIVLLCGGYLFISNTSDVVIKHGLWDAWAIWNLHANYLAEPEYWQAMFKNADGAHPDYPLALPSILAFGRQLLQQDNYWIFTHAIHALITFTIPVLIFSEVYNKNKILAAIAFLILCNNIYFITHGVSQFADTLLSLFFLIALISIYYADNKKQVAIAAMFLGLCMWTKNEGVIIATITLLFNFKLFFKKGNIKHTLAGITPIVITLLIFKVGYAPSNDLVHAQGSETQAYLLDKSRYVMIYDSFVNNLNEHFSAIKKGILLYALLCLVSLKSPSKLVVMILFICAVYMSIYVITHQDLEWHLFTSQGRLMHQLAAPLIFVLAMEMSKQASIDILPAKNTTL